MKIETEADVDVTRLDQRGPLESVTLRPDAPEVACIMISTSLHLFKDAHRAAITIEKNAKTGHVKITIETMEGRGG